MTKLHRSEERGVGFKKIIVSVGGEPSPTIPSIPLIIRCNYILQIHLEKLAETEVMDTGIFVKLPAYRVHRHHIFRIVVVYPRKIAKLPGDSLLGRKKIRHLDIYRLITPGRHKIHFPGTKNADADFEPLSQQVKIDHILHHLLDAAAKIESAEEVAKPVVGEVVFANHLKQPLAMDVIALHRVDYQCLAQILDLCRRQRTGNLIPRDFIWLTILFTEMSLPSISAMNLERFSINGTFLICSRATTSLIIMVL